MDRREVLRWAPMVAGLMAREGVAREGLTREQLRASLAVLGLGFDEGQITMMLPNVERALDSFARLRALPVPLDTEPAIRFDPVLPGHKLPAGRPVLRPLPARTGGRFKDIEELAFRPVQELATLLRLRRVSSTELTKMYLGRLKRHSAGLHCTITLTEDLALAQAAEADREIRQGRYRWPLHGVPYGAKDLFATKGYKTTWGAEPFAEQKIDQDATVIERCWKAGAVLVAKLSMGALAQGGLWFGGMTRNPWNIEQTSSGSSAGSASATAAGLVGFALGTETLGSIVSPSTRCGVTGLRPTFGRVSRHGAMALCWTMDKVGPITRSVDDAMLVLRAIAGPDGKDLTVRGGVPLHWDARLPLGGLRVGVLRKEFEKIGEAGRKAVYQEALVALDRAGVTLRDVELPEFPTGALLVMLNAEAAAAFDDITRDGQVGKLSGQKAGDWPNSFRSARTIPAVEYLRAARGRTLLMREWERFFADWDVLVAPTGSATLAMTNLTGHPQLVVPCGMVEGQPQGLLFTGGLYEEGRMARVALAFEQATAWHRQMPPGYAV